MDKSFTSLSRSVELTTSHKVPLKLTKSQPPVSTSTSFDTSTSEPTPQSSVDPVPDPEYGSKGSDSSQNQPEHETSLEVPSNSEETTKVKFRTKARLAAKRKNSWFNVIGPSYKRRQEEFERSFKELALTEKPVADYACALQKEILVHGRIYATQNYLCFYSQIFKKWETSSTFKWTDVTSITKEKMAMVIPNAIIIHTATEKHLFTSLLSREKTYKILVKIWRNAVKGNLLSYDELYRFVHGDGEEVEEPIQDWSSLPQISSEQDEMIEGLDWDESFDGDDAKCDQDHEGRILMDETFNTTVDRIFTWLFTNSKFLIEFHAGRGTTDLKLTNWEKNVENNTKTRSLSMTVALSNSIGPKSSAVTETQTLHKCSRPGKLYSVDAEVSNAGIPYADSFYLFIHYCITKLDDNRSHVIVFGKVVYRKSVFGLAKRIIEKGALSGFGETYDAFTKSIHEECARGAPGRSKIKKELTQLADETGVDAVRKNSIHQKQASNQFPVKYLFFILFISLLVLFIVNAILYLKLQRIEESGMMSADVPGVLAKLGLETDLLKDLEEVFMNEWQNKIAEAIELIKQTEQSLIRLKETKILQRND